MNEDEKAGSIRLAALFSDHAVLQRDIPVPVWGWTKPGLQLRVTLGPYSALTLAAKSGKFQVRLPPMPAGGPYELEARALNADLCTRVKDVMVGEVWVCSGQSNMQWPVSEVHFDPRTLSEADTRIRALNVPNRAQMGVSFDVDAVWQTADPESVKGFSAVGFFFGRRLARELDVAVGLINASWGGTRIEPWISREELVRHDRTRQEVARYEASFSCSSSGKVMDLLKRNDPEAGLDNSWYPKDPENTGFRDHWADRGHDDAQWQQVDLPGPWERFGHDTNGVFWFRREISIPANWVGKDLALGIGAVDKHDTTYFNGEQVGSTGEGQEEQHWCVPRLYTVPGRLVKEGPALIAVRAYSFIYSGGMIGPREKMRLGPANERAEPMALDGIWRMKMEHDFGRIHPKLQPYGPGNPQTPYILNENMIQPLIPYAIRGATWYQGESNEEDQRAYGPLLRALIRDWRRAWGQGDFPFLTVQLANFRLKAAYKDSALWPWIREAQLESLHEKNTGLAVTIDIGDAMDIHPRNKQDVGSRLAQWALARTYAKPIVPSGPLYREMVVEGERIRLRFDHIGGGLESRNGALKTFAIAGLDKKFTLADAKIEADTVVVSSAEVSEPVAVRYAWADNPDGCNLYNREGLPASPFRTDAW